MPNLVISIFFKSDVTLILHLSITIKRDKKQMEKHKMEVVRHAFTSDNL